MLKNWLVSILLKATSPVDYEPASILDTLVREFGGGGVVLKKKATSNQEQVKNKSHANNELYSLRCAKSRQVPHSVPPPWSAPWPLLSNVITSKHPIV